MKKVMTLNEQEEGEVGSTFLAAKSKDQEKKKSKKKKNKKTSVINTHLLKQYLKKIKTDVKVSDQQDMKNSEKNP